MKPINAPRWTVSVIIPTYNYGRFIRTAIESVLMQTYPTKEIIIVDDGSVDETDAIVSYFGNKVQLLKQTRNGVSSARNAGIEKSSSELIAFLDADDSWLPNKLEKQVALFTGDESVGLVHCGMREFDDETGKINALHLDGGEGWLAADIALLERPAIIGPGGTMLVRRDVFDVVGYFDERLTNGEDWEFCLRVARKYKIGFVAEPLLNYRNHGTNATKDVSKMERSTLIAWKKAFDTKDPQILSLRRRSYGNLHKVLAGSFLNSRQYMGFIRNFIKSLWFRPSLLLYYLRRPFLGKGGF